MARVTPLYEKHQQLGARIVEFGGFMMPVQYTGIIEEHATVRRHVGIFDVCHMGEIEVSGPEALAFLERLVTRRLEGLSPGRLAYGLLCNEEGGIIDDLTVYRRKGGYYLVVNAATTATDYEWLVQHRDKWGMEATVKDVSEATGKIDVQGPKAVELAERLGYGEAARLKHFAFMEVPDNSAIVSRSGYTGEDGFEFYLPAKDTPALWDEMLDKGKDLGILPCGLGARDTLRLEACLVLSGSDIGPSYDPFRAGLGWAVDLAKKNLVAVKALARAAENVKKGKTTVLAPFVLDGRSSARHGDIIFNGDTKIGVVTSGSYCPSLERAAGMGYMADKSARVGAAIEIEVRKRRLVGKVAARPLYSATRRPLS